MGQKTFDMILRLASKGYTVSFSKAEGFKPSTVLRLELRKKDKHQVRLVDISIKSLPYSMNTDDLISKTLDMVEWEFEYEFEKERNA